MVFFSLFLMTFSPYLAFIPALFCGYGIIQRNYTIYKNVWNVGLLFLFAWSFIVGLANFNSVSTMASFAFLLYFFVSIYIQDCFTREDQMEKLFKIMLLISLGSAVIGILEWYTPLHNQSSFLKQLLGIYPQVSFFEKYRISGTFGNPNVAGTWYSAMVIISLYFFQNSKGLKRLYYGITSIIFVAVLSMTGSRGAIIGLLAGLIVFSYFAGHRRITRVLSAALVVGVILMVIFPDFFPRGRYLVESITDRAEIWLNCLKLFIYKPITGWGIMGIYFADGSIYHYTRTYHAHNMWLTMAATTGLIGLGAFIYMKYNLFEGLLLLSRKGSSITPLLAGIQGLVLGQGLIDFTIMNPQGGLIFFGCAAMICSLANQYSPAMAGQFGLYTMRVRNRLQKTR